MNRRKGKEAQKPNKHLIDHKDLERNILTEISKELVDDQAKKTKKGNK